MLDSIPFICFLSFLVDAGVDDDGLECCISSSQRECCLELSWCWPRRAEAEATWESPVRLRWWW